jgi:tetratricopeptide (TPR) repeat protein
MMGSIAYHQGRYEDATALIERSLDAKRALGDDWGVSVGLLNLGVLRMMHGDPEGSRRNFEESLALKRVLGDSQGIAIVLNNLADLALYEDEDYAAARDTYTESLALRRSLGDRQGVGIALVSLARAALEDGDRKAAGALAAESLEIFAELGDRENLTTVLECIADLALGNGSAARALRLRGAAEALREAMGTPLPPPEERWRIRTHEAALTALGEAEANAAIADGRRLDAEAAVGEALRIVHSNDP